MTTPRHSRASLQQPSLKSRGRFVHSLAEKYVIVRQGIFLERWSKRGEIFGLSAQTFPEGGRPQRTVIFREGTDFWAGTIGERFITNAFQTAGKSIPKPAPAPPPPPPTALVRRSSAANHYLSAWLETCGEFSQLEWKGTTPHAARLWEKSVVAGILIITLAFVGYCLWPVCLPQQEAESEVLLPHTTSEKLWTLTGLTIGFFVLLIFLAPGFGRDRGLGQLHLHLLLPYAAAWEAMPNNGGRRAPLALFLFLGQIGIYYAVLGYWWVRNRLGLATLILVVIHVLEIAFSVRVAFDRYR